jgi:hypothetical protein
MMFVPRTKHTYGPPRPVTGVSFTFECRLCSYLTENTPMRLHGLSRGDIYIIHVDDVLTSHETHLWASTLCYGG